MLRIRFGLTLTIIGFLVFVLGAAPGTYGLDRSPVIGFLQISIFLIGLGLMCLGGYISLSALWRRREKTILADIGQRLVSTGYLIAMASGMADLLGLGTQPITEEIPYFGLWQEIGVLLGMSVIAIGFLMFIPYRPQNAATVQSSEKPKIQVDGE